MQVATELLSDFINLFISQKIRMKRRVGCRAFGKHRFLCLQEHITVGMSCLCAFLLFELAIKKPNGSAAMHRAANAC